MDLTGIVILALGGAAAGFLAGFFGVGGGILLVPILLYFFQSIGVSSLVGTHLAFGTSLLIVACTSASSAREYATNGHVVWKAVALIGIASIAGAWVGSLIAGGLEGQSLKKVFAAVVVISAIRLLSEQRKPKGNPEPNTKPIPLVLTGLIVGAVSSLAGVGGGVFSIPIMYSLLHFPLKRALGTSSATIVITALAAATGYAVRGAGNPLLPSFTLGYVGYLYALPVVVTSLPLAHVGASVAHATQPALLKKIFAGFLIIIAATMFLS